MTITATPISTTAATSASTSSTSSTTSATSSTGLADNFTTFLTLLTTQLKNQNPLDPMDTNQFTQQLVQFAQVEQQMKSNDQLTSLVNIEKSAQSTTALAYVGQNVVIDGSTTNLSGGSATWSFNTTKPASATVTIKDSTGQTAYSGSFSVNPGTQNFVWDGLGSDGKQWPDGTYTMAVSGKDTSGQPVNISTEVTTSVQSVDFTQTPPVMSDGNTTFTSDKIKRVIARTS